MSKLDADYYKNAVRVVNEFKDLLNSLKTTLNICDLEITEADKAFSDIRHLCELDYPNTHKGKTEVCRIIRETSLSRRIAKDTEEVLKPLVDFLEISSLKSFNSTNQFIQALSKTANEMKKAENKVTNTRVYKPRVLNELFDKKEG